MPACFAIKGLPVCKVHTYAEKEPSIGKSGLRVYDLQNPICGFSRAGARREAKEPPSIIPRALSHEIAGSYCLGFMFHHPLSLEADSCLQS